MECSLSRYRTYCEHNVHPLYAPLKTQSSPCEHQSSVTELRVQGRQLKQFANVPLDVPYHINWSCTQTASIVSQSINISQSSNAAYIMPSLIPTTYASTQTGEILILTIVMNKTTLRRGERASPGETDMTSTSQFWLRFSRNFEYKCTVGLSYHILIL